MCVLTCPCAKHVMQPLAHFEPESLRVPQGIPKGPYLAALPMDCPVGWCARVLKGPQKYLGLIFGVHSSQVRCAFKKIFVSIVSMGL